MDGAEDDSGGCIGLVGLVGCLAGCLAGWWACFEGLVCSSCSRMNLARWNSVAVDIVCERAMTQ